MGAYNRRGFDGGDDDIHIAIHKRCDEEFDRQQQEIKELRAELADLKRDAIEYKYIMAYINDFLFGYDGAENYAEIQIKRLTEMGYRPFCPDYTLQLTTERERELTESLIEWLRSLTNGIYRR